MSNAIVRASDMLERAKDRFIAVIPANIDRNRFYAVALAITKDPNLRDCAPLSIIDAVYRIAKLGLDPDKLLGEAYVIPRKIKGVPMACFQPGYRGLTKLARKSRTVADIHAEVVYEGEPFRVYYGTQRRIEHEPSVSVDLEPGAIRAAYVTWKDLASGTVNFHVIDRTRIARARKMGAGSGPWETDTAAMVRKTAIIDASKFWQLSPELAEAVGVQERADAELPIDPILPASIVQAGAADAPARSELDDFDALPSGTPTDDAEYHDAAMVQTALRASVPGHQDDPGGFELTPPSPEEQARIIREEQEAAKRR